ncbi:MAG: amino acid adenylation domain-containing protein, partial [Methylobacter sp.]
MTDITTQAEQQQANRAQLIARLKKTDTTPSVGVIAKRNRDQSIPLSYSQERLWIMSQLEPDNPIYNVAGAVQFDGLLNRQALQNSLDEVVRRHEILRSRFTADGQQVLPGSGLPMTRLDLAGFQPDKAMEQFQHCADDFIRRPFLLAEQPPLRALLAVFGERRHILLLTLHHIVSDRWSVGVLMQEVSALYDSYIQGQPSALPELPIQYGDFCVWQRGQQEKWAKYLDYWRRKLSGAPPLLELPTDRPRPPVPSYGGDLHNFEFSAELSWAVKQLGKQYNATLFMVMAAAFNTLLYRYTGSRDVCIGYPVAGRNQTQTTALIGFFVNTLVLRCEAEADLPFSELLLQLRDQALQDQNHQELSFGQLLDALNPVRNTSHAPLFQVMLAVQNVPMPDFRMQDVSATPLTMNNRIAQFDLSLFIDERDGKLSGSFEYSSDLFDAGIIVRMAGHLQTLLAGAVNDPGLPLSRLPMLAEAETRLLLDDWSGVGRAVRALDAKAHPTAIHRLFEMQAQTMPDKTAVAFAGQHISYGELNQRAELWAEQLKALGVGPECRIGVCAERSVELTVGLLAVLKAGAAYVPLDPGYPEERLEFMLDDAGIEILLIQSVLADKFAHRAIKMLCLDEDSVQSQEKRIASRSVSPDNTAYIIYTSGSTGQPKGVAVSHRNLLHSTLARTDYYREPVGCFLLLSSFAFDSSVAGIFWTLSQGGCLCLPQQQDLTDPAALAGLIDRQRVTHLLALPSFYTAIINDGNLARLQTLQTVIVAGEACSGEVAAEHHRKLPEVRFYNEYGPTEGTVWSSVYRSTKSDVGAMLPIGRAIANVRIYILDRQYQPVPIGVSGELCIGGAGLAQGYLNRPMLTAEKFIPNPFDANGERLYKTGDLARFRADGEIEFLGRIDNQVKIRGYRIELGEIETRLLQHPGIEAAVVLAKEDVAGNKRLIAYLVGQTSSLPETRQLQHYLGQVLPVYMVPSVFIGLDKLPLTPNGKVDHKRLPQPDSDGLSAKRYEPPQTPVENILADIWAELLAVKRVGRHDNFFELGGDSILSIQVVSRARQAGVVLTATQLFHHQTVAALALIAGQNTVVPAEQGMVSGEVPLTPIQHWFFEQNLDNPDHWNQALFLDINPGLTPELFERALNQLPIQHDMLRARFNREGGEWKQVIVKDEMPAVFERIDLSNVPAERQAAMLESAASVVQAELSLSDGPLLRAAWFDLGAGRTGRVLIAIHHLVVDGVSWRILLEDLAIACRQLMSGQTPALPAKTASFKSWSEFIVNRAATGGLPLDRAYWLDARRRLVSLLPVDEPGGGNSVAIEDEVRVSLPEADTRALLQDAPGAYRTKIDDLLLTALTLALCDWTRCESVLIDLESHGREDIADGLDISRTVGWFTNVYPALLSVTGGSSLAETLKSIKEQLRNVPLKGMSYGLLRYVSPDAELLAQQPKAQIIFNYLGQLDTVMAADAPFVPTREAVGASGDPAGTRPHELAVVVAISDGSLQLSWKYSRERYRRDTIEALAGNYLQHLNALIAQCALPGSGGYTPSDFPLTDLSQPDLDAMALEPRQIEDVYPLAPLQHGLLFHSLYAPESGVYCIQLGCRLVGELNVPAFKQAWQLLADRHPILRTCFQVGDREQALQIVHKHAQVPVTEYDWRRYSPEQQKQRWQQLLADDQASGFDFGSAPLMRLGLVQCSDNVHYLVWSYHHVLLDGWSSPVLIKDVFAAYEALNRGSAPSFPAVRPYRDYIAWLQQQDTAAAETYWKSALAGFSAPTPLPIDKAPDNAVLHEKDAQAKQALVLPEALSRALQDFVKQRQLTLNTLVQGAWGLLLSRYSGESDVLFGATVSGRPADLSGIEAMVGLFINSLPIRIRVPADSTVIDWLQALFVQNQDMRRFEYTPLTQIQGWSEVARGLPLFESLLVFENYPIDQALTEKLDSLTIDDITVVDRTSYPLTLSAFPGTELGLEIGYSADRFEAGTIERMLGHLQRLLEIFIEQPEKRLSELSIISEAEQQQILIDWNATETDYPKDRYIHQLFETQAEQTPDALALAFEGQTLTYAELNAKANQLAHYLIGQGVGPDMLVGVCLERSLE